VNTKRNQVIAIICQSASIIPIFGKLKLNYCTMLTFNECQAIISQYFKELKLPELPANLYDPIRYMLNMGGKRIRPALVLMGCNVFSENTDSAIFPALAIEVFHNFTLMHDDIMDKSILRRSKPTVYIKWNQNIAILSGDAMLIKAYELLTTEALQQMPLLLSIFNDTALKVCEGQQYDLDFENNINVSIDEYINMVELKTAVLLAASLKMGAIIGGANQRDADLIYEFGKNIGIAFQLQDDLLDVFADTAAFGKVMGNDINSNKKTILLIQALNLSSDKIRKELIKWLKIKNVDQREKINAVRKIYVDLNLEELTKIRIKNYHNQGIQMLNRIAVEKLKILPLLDFSKFLMLRKK
jgi:geranylgeranyl diphosphate synthase type II